MGRRRGGDRVDLVHSNGFSKIIICIFSAPAKEGWRNMSDERDSIFCSTFLLLPRARTQMLGSVPKEGW